MTLAMKLDENRELGEYKEKVSAVRNGKGIAADELVMKLLGLDKKQYNEISDMIDKFPDKSDWDIAEAILFG